MTPDLRPCPACGKRADELKESIGSRFPTAVCGWNDRNREAARHRCEAVERGEAAEERQSEGVTAGGG